jgi:hypothetical protein
MGGSTLTRMASVYLRDGRLFVIPMSKSEAGVRVGDANPLLGVFSDSDADLGRLVEVALDQSLDGVPHPDSERIKHLFDPVVEAAGVKSAQPSTQLRSL